MKYLTALTLSILTILSLSSCSSSPTVNPSQNKALNGISNSDKGTNKKGSMQSSLDSWLKNDWTPSVEKDEKIKEKNQDKGRDFKVQEYVDKIEVYKKESPKSTQESHTDMLNSLPVIGK